MEKIGSKKKISKKKKKKDGRKLRKENYNKYFKYNMKYKTIQ